MANSTTVLAKLLADNPGPVSIVAGIKALRAIGVTEPDSDLQSTIGSFAAQRGRSILFDLPAPQIQPIHWQNPTATPITTP